jgi:Carbohydrate-selective porin, OprB family
MYFIGAKLWKDAEIWIDPELDQGFGLSNTKGIAGFPSGASFKVGSDVPYASVQRFFLRQTIDLGGKSQKVEADQNQFAGSNTTDRLVFTVGKFPISDVFDQNKYAQNPRKDFMNWALIDAGSYDYAADAWGYTYSVAVEWYQGAWTCGAACSTSLRPQMARIWIRPSASQSPLCCNRAGWPMFRPRSTTQSSALRFCCQSWAGVCKRSGPTASKSNTPERKCTFRR